MHYLHVYYIICIRATCYTIGRKVATCYVIGRKVGKVHIKIIERWTVLGAPYGALVIGDFTPQLMKMTSTGFLMPLHGLFCLGVILNIYPSYTNSSHVFVSEQFSREN